LLLNALHTTGWGFLCLNLTTLSLLLPSEEFLLFEIAALATPVVILVGALLYYRSLTGLWWSSYVVAGAVGGVAGSGWLWFVPGHARLQNTLYSVAPAVYCLSWACVGLLVASALGRLRRRSGRWQGYLRAALAVAGGVYGALFILMPEMPGPSDYPPLLSPVLVVETAFSYGMIWIATRRAGSEAPVT
jgi:hypothetical protein